MIKPSRLSIYKQNINKSLTSQLDLLVALRRDTFNICVIQEPYINFRGKSRANLAWSTVYPSTHHNAPDSTRSLLLMNTDIDPFAWQQINIPHLDITAIEIATSMLKLRIYNVYNDSNNNNTFIVSENHQ